MSWLATSMKMAPVSCLMLLSKNGEGLVNWNTAKKILEIGWAVNTSITSDSRSGRTIAATRSLALEQTPNCWPISPVFPLPPYINPQLLKGKKKIVGLNLLHYMVKEKKKKEWKKFQLLSGKETNVSSPAWARLFLWEKPTGQRPPQSSRGG